MAVSSAAVSVSVSVGELSSLVARQYARALSSSTLVFYPSSTVRTLVAHDVRWQLRVVPSLLAKSRAQPQPHPASAPAPAPAPAPADVFAPPYNADLLVGTLPSHAVLLNKFCVVPEHFLLVTQHFESQDRPPAPDTIALAYSIIKHARTDTLAFYNCGKDSGASQPHRHVQFIPLDADGIPVEKMLDRIEKDGREMGESTIHIDPHQERTACRLTMRYADADGAGSRTCTCAPRTVAALYRPPEWERGRGVPRASLHRAPRLHVPRPYGRQQPCRCGRRSAVVQHSHLAQGDAPHPAQQGELHAQPRRRWRNRDQCQFTRYVCVFPTSQQARRCSVR